MFFPQRLERVAPEGVTHLLDPRNYRVDDLLRRPGVPGQPFLASGDRLRAAISSREWGFGGGVHRSGTTGEDRLIPFVLRLFADGEEVLPEDAICRPSHVTRNARHAGSGLQVTSDAFLTGDDVIVSVLSLRNPGDIGVEIEIDLRYGVRNGECIFPGGARMWVHRAGPPPDDLRGMLPERGRGALVVAVAFADSAEAARTRAERWARSDSPAREQVEICQRWFDRNVPRFDCPDPWIAKLWYHHAWLARRDRRRIWPDALAAPTGVPNRFPEIRALGMAQFEDGDFNRPHEDASFADWPALVVSGLIGLRFRREDVLEMRPLLPEGEWSCFCLENLPFHGRRLTLVWDDPACEGDAYDDGDKGLTIIVDGRRFHHQADLSPFTAPLPQSVSRAPRRDR